MINNPEFNSLDVRTQEKSFMVTLNNTKVTV